MCKLESFSIFYYSGGVAAFKIPNKFPPSSSIRILISEDIISRPTKRLVEGMQYLGELVYPTYFKKEGIR